MMMEVLATVFNPRILIYVIVGVASGICIGALPGLTATMGVALILPLTFGMEASQGMLLLLGTYVGAIYGGSISAILLKTPGTPASAATALDGYAFSQRGEGGRALGIATMSSFMGGMVSCVALMLISPQLAKLALQFSSPEFFMLAIFGLGIIASVSGKSLAKGLICGCIGLLASMAGIDAITGFVRYDFGNINLLNGIAYIPAMIGLFAMSEVFNSIEGMHNKEDAPQKISRIIPTKDDFKLMLKHAPISGAIGTMIGIIPGAGADIGAFVSYNLAKQTSKHPEKFGTGLPEAVAAAEGGNNGVTGGALIPMLTLGIPGDATAAIMIGALTIQGLQPGPLLFTEHQDLMYVIFLGMMLSNVIMMLLGFSSLKLFVKVLSVPKTILTPLICMLCVVGSYAINMNFFDVGVMLFFGILGYFMKKVDIPSSPAVLGIILGPMAESHFRRALIMSGGNYATFVSTPISIFFLVLTIVTVVVPVVRSKMPAKKQAV